MIYGYTRVSTDKQTTDNQKLAILEYAQTNKITLDKVVETVVESPAQEIKKLPS